MKRIMDMLRSLKLVALGALIVIDPRCILSMVHESGSSLALFFPRLNPSLQIFWFRNQPLLWSKLDRDSSIPQYGSNIKNGRTDRECLDAGESQWSTKGCFSHWPKLGLNQCPSALWFMHNCMSIDHISLISEMMHCGKGKGANVALFHNMFNLSLCTITL